MASVERTRDSEGRERFAARWREGTKQMKARRDKDGQPFKSARAALKYAQDQESDARRGRTPVRSDTTVGEYAAYWRTTRNHRPTTQERLKYMHKHFEATGLAKRKLIDVRQTMVQAWAADRERAGLAPSTMRKLVTDLGAVFRSAEHDSLIAKTPVVNIQLAEDDEVERLVPLTVEDVEALAAHMPRRYRAMVIVQANTGVRVGELLGLTEDAVDYEAGKVHIREQRTRKTPQLRSELKTRSSKRSVPLTDRVAEEVPRHLAAGYSNGVDLFATTTGAVPHASHYGQLITTAARKAGLPAGTSSHDLRHHYASVLLDKGFSTVAVGQLLGHRDGTLVEKVYGRSMPDTDDRVLKVLNALWNADEVLYEDL